MIDDFRDEAALQNGGDIDAEADTQKISRDYESLYSKMIDAERLALSSATREFFSKKEIVKANNASVSFILTRGIDELVRFLEHKLKSGDTPSSIFVYQRLKFYCLDGLDTLGEDLDNLIQHLRTDEYYRGKKVVNYWQLRRRRVEAYKKGVEKIVKTLKLLFAKVEIPASMLETEIDNSDDQITKELEALIKSNSVDIPASLADLFKIK